MLPHSAKDPQQVRHSVYPPSFVTWHLLHTTSITMLTTPLKIARKRHLGNDVVVIVFQDGGKFNPTSLRNQFNRMFT